MASQSADLWVKFNQPNMKQKMLETGAQIRNATSEILEAATILHDDPYSKPGKKILLKGAKGVMEHMVVLLQQADLYEVTRIVRGCSRVSNKKGIALSLEAGESYFTTAAQELVTQTVELAKMIVKRVKEIDDIALKRRFDEASTKLRADIDAFLKAMGNVMRNDVTARETSNILSRQIDESVQEIITVAKLSAKSPFDLSMIEGIDLRDDEDLKDMATLMRSNLAHLQRAIDAGDPKDANKILKAVRKGLQELVALNKALAKAAEDPVLKARYEAAAREAQRMLDEVLPSFSDAVDELLKKPNSQAALKAVRGFMDELGKATDLFAQAASKPDATDIEYLLQNMEEPLSQLLEAAQRGDVQSTNKLADVVRANVGEQMAMADTIVRNTADPVRKAQLERAVDSSKRSIATNVIKLNEASRMAALDPTNLQVMDALKRAAQGLVGACAELVKGVSVGTAQDILLNHQLLETEHQKLVAALQAGDRKEAVAAMRAIRKLLNDQLNAAKAIARTTNDPELKAQLDAVCANAQKSIDSLMGRLASLADAAIADPTNGEAFKGINEIFGEAQALSAKMVAAVGDQLLRASHQALLQNINNMEEAVAAPDARSAVASLKAALTEATRQADVARLVANNLQEAEPDRATRVYELADALSSATPTLVAASKAALSAPGDDVAYAEMHKNADKLRDISSSLVSAATLAPEEELLENAAMLNLEMARMMNGLDNGEILQADQVASIIKKVAAQVKLASVVGNRSKDPKNKNNLLKASQILSKLMASLVGVCRDAMANPNDPAVRGRLKQLLGDILAANRDTYSAFAPVDDESLQAAADDLQLQVANLERALKDGSAADVDVATRNLEKSAAKQGFLARAVLERIDDPDRKKQVLSAIEELDRLVQSIGPAAKAAKANPRDGTAQIKAANLLDELRAASQNVVSSASSSPEERMATKALVIGAQLEELEDFVRKGNAAAANATLQNITAGTAQEVRMARAAATTATPANRIFLIAAADTLEKLPAVIASDVKSALSGDKAAQLKLGFDVEATRGALGDIVANASSSNRLPIDQVSSVAANIKNEIDKLATATKGNNAKVAAEAVTHTRKGALQQETEILRAYAAKVDDPAQRRAVDDAIDELDRLLKDGLFPSLTSAQANPNDRAAVSRVTAPAEAVSASLNSIISASTLSAEDRVVASALAAVEELAKVEGAVKKKSEPETAKALTSLKPALLDVAKATRAAAAVIRNQAQKQKLFETADALESAHNEISEAAYVVLSRPVDTEAQKRFAAAVEQARASLETAVALSASSPEKQVAKIALRLAAEIDYLTGSVEGGSPVEAQAALTNIKDSLPRQIHFARAIADSIENPESKNGVLAGLDRVKKSAPPLVTAAEAAVKTPQDATARQKLRTAANETKEGLAEVLASAVHPEERLLANTPHLDASVDKLVISSRANAPAKVKAQIATVTGLMAEQALLSRAVAARAAPEVRADIIRDAVALETLVPQIIKPATEIIARPTDKAAQERLAGAATSVKAANKTLTGHAQMYKVDREKKTQERLRKQREEREREDQERRERVQKEQDEVAAAAAKLRERTRNLKTDNSVEGSLYFTAKGIAGLMEALSKAALAGDKRGMIEAARALAIAAQKYVEQSKAAAAKCTDPKLKEQIITSAQAAKNWSVQLKIIAAVKAASDEDSGSAKQQLVKCAKGLAKAIVSSVNAVEISALRK